MVSEQKIFIDRILSLKLTNKETIIDIDAPYYICFDNERKGFLLILNRKSWKLRKLLVRIFSLVTAILDGNHMSVNVVYIERRIKIIQPTIGSKTE